MKTLRIIRNRKRAYTTGTVVKTGRRYLDLAALLILVLACTSASSAGTFVAFGPEDFVRSSGSPATVSHPFTVLNPETSYSIQINNGGLEDAESELVSSSVFILNGVQIVSPNEIDDDVIIIEKPVTLDYNNELSVEVRSKPGGAVTVQIIGIDNAPPTITATVDPPANAAGWNNTNVKVSFECTDAISGIASCTDPVPVTGEGDGQVISGTAVDNAGNTATTSVTINIDKTSPELTVLFPTQGEHLASPDITASGTVSDALAGVESVHVNGITAIIGPPGWAADVAGLTGEATITVRSLDFAGNEKLETLNVLCNMVCQLPTTAKEKISSVLIEQFISGDVTEPIEALINVADVQTPLPELAGVDILTDYRPTLAKVFVKISDPSTLASLVQENNTEYVHENAKYYLTALPWQEAIGQDHVELSGYLGTGTAVVILDDGGRDVAHAELPNHGVIDLSDPAFGGCTGVGTPDSCRVVAEMNPHFADPCLRSHATHVARRVALTAPGVDIIGWDVGFQCEIDDRAYLQDNAIAEAYKWVIEHQHDYNIVAVNMSFSSYESYSTEDCPTYNDEMNRWLHEAGITLIAGSGNEGHTDGVGSPACQKYVVSVGGSDGSEIWGDTQRGPNLDLLAPARDHDYGESGTSLSAPTVAGASAIFRAALPDLSPDEILDFLKTTGTPIFDPASGLTFREIRIDAALREAGLPVQETACPCFTASELNSTDWDIWCRGPADLRWEYLLDNSSSEDPGPYVLAYPSGASPTCASGNFYTPDVKTITSAEAESCRELIVATGTNQGTRTACRID